MAERDPDRDRDLDSDVDPGFDLDPALRSAVRAARADAGPEPTPEELLAYHRGELSADEAERFEERLAAHPDAVRLLAAFTGGDEPRPEDPDYLSDADKAAAREELRRRVAERAGRPGAAVTPLAPRRSERQSAIPRWAERVAAVLLIGVLGGLWAVRGERIERLDREVAELREPRIGDPRIVVPDSIRRGSGDESVPRLSRERAHLLTLPIREAPQFPDYRLEIVPAGDPGTEPVWARSGLVRERDDSFALFLPARSLPAGAYRLHLFGVDGEEETLLATYSIEMR